MFKKIFLTSLCLIVFFTVISSPVNAQTASTSVIDTSYGAYSSGNYTLNDIMTIVINVSGWILGIVGSLALLMFVYGGFMFLISAGSSDKIGQAQKILVAAVIGLIIVFSSYMIIRFVAQAVGVDWQGGKILPATSSTGGSGTIPNDCVEKYGDKGFTCRDEASSGYCVKYHCGNGSSVCCAPSCSEYSGYSCMSPSSGTNCKTNLCKGDGTECCQSK
jgi:hypothetical protein